MEATWDVHAASTHNRPDLTDWLHVFRAGDATMHAGNGVQ